MKSMGMFHGAVGNIDLGPMHSCPQPEHLIERQAELVKGMNNVWYEYVPESYDPSKKYPLIVQLHGGGMDGMRWTKMTAWHLLAEEKGLIVIYPNSPGYQTWALGERDVQFLYDLIQTVCNQYSIDRSRIYMQGMSNGDQMTLAFSLKHPEILAAAGFATGPTAAYLFEDGEQPAGALPVIQMRGEKDVLGGAPGSEPTAAIYELRYSMNDLNKEIWEAPNGHTPLPVLTVKGKDNFLFYKGEKADLVYWEVRDMGHREPPDEAQTFWERMYSGWINENGKHINTGVDCPLTGDDNAYVLSLGSGIIYKKDRIVSMGGDENAIVRYFAPMGGGGFGSFGLDEMLETGALFAPAEFFAAAFGAVVEHFNAGTRVKVTFDDGKVAVFYAGSTMVHWEEGYRSMKKPSVQLCGKFYIPVGEFCGDLMDLCVSEADDCMLISSRQSQLGRYTARTMRKLLGGQKRPPEPKN